MFRKQYRSTRLLANSFREMATTKETMNPENQAAKLLTPARKALNNIINNIRLAMPVIERINIEKDVKEIVAAITKSEPCQHELKYSLTIEGSILECRKCGSRWKFKHGDAYYPLDATICECCGQKKTTV